MDVSALQLKFATQVKEALILSEGSPFFSKQALVDILFWSNQNLRLTHNGCKIFSLIKPLFDFSTYGLSGTDFIKLGRFYAYPYFIGPGTITIFSEEDNFLLMLNGKNVKTWIASL